MPITDWANLKKKLSDAYESIPLTTRQNFEDVMNGLPMNPLTIEPKVAQGLGEGALAAGMVANPKNAAKMKQALLEAVQAGESGTKLALTYIANKYPKFSNLVNKIKLNYSLGPGTLGAHIPSENVIELNPSSMAGQSYTMPVDTIAHELTHAWQDLKPSRTRNYTREGLNQHLWDTLPAQLQAILTQNNIDRDSLSGLAEKYASINMDTSNPKNPSYRYFPAKLGSDLQSPFANSNPLASNVVGNMQYSLYNNQPVEVQARQGGKTATDTFRKFMQMMFEDQRTADYIGNSYFMER